MGLPLRLLPVAALLAAARCDVTPSAVGPDAGPTTAISELPGTGRPLPLPVIPAGQSTLRSLSISTGSLSPPFSSETLAYHLDSLNTLFPISVTATTDDPTAVLRINGQPAESGVPFSLTLALREGITVFVEGSAAPALITTVAAVPPNLPGITTWSSPLAGSEDVLLTAGTFLLRVDRSGAPVFYRDLSPARAFDFQSHRLPSQELFYSYNAIDPVSPTEVKTVLMGRRFEPLDTLALLPHGDHGRLPCDPHDFVLVGERHYLLIATVPITVDLSGLDPAWSPTARIDAPVIQEIDHGRVVFEWSSTRFPSLYRDSVTSNSFQSGALSDYLHINSIQVDPLDQNLIVSFRHSDSVIKIDRSSGEILWTLGGRSDDFALSPGQRFSHQHFARRQPDGSLWIFDDGNDLHQTRVISFTFDPSERRVSDFQVGYQRPANQPPTSFMGSVTPLPGERILIGWGGWDSAAVSPPDASEVLAGNPVWTLTFDSPSVFSYRVLPSSGR